MIGYLLRTHISPYAALPVAAFYLINLAQRHQDWRGDIVLAADAQTLVLFWAGTFVMAASAVDAARDSTRPHLVRLARPVGRPYLLSWLAAVLPSALVAAVVGAVSVLGAASFYWSGRAVPGVVAQLVVQIIVLGLFGALGSLIGRFSSPLVAGLIGATLGVTMQFAQYSLSVHGFQILGLVGSNASLAGFQFNTGLTVVRCVLLLILTAAALTVIPHFTETGPRLQPRGVVLPLALIIISFAPLPLLGTWDRIVPGSDDSMRCDGQAPVVCLSPEHDHLRAVYSPVLEKLVRGAQAKHLTALAPDTVYEAFPSTESEPGATFPINELDGTPPTLEDLAGNLLIPRACPNLATAQIGPLTDRRITELVVTWVAAAGGDAEGSTTRLTPTQAKTAVTALTSCHLDQ